MHQAEAESSRGKILVIDDDDLFRESLSTNLTDAGFATDAFGEGLTAIRHLEQKSDADLVLLDWKMPGMNGIEVLQKMRAEKIDIPVIFLTVLSDQIYEEAGLLGGAVDFVEKSRSFAILLRRIELILGNEKRRWQAQRPVGNAKAHEGLVLRYDSRRVLWHDMNVALTLTEFNIVAYLTEHAERDVSYREIYDIVHGEGFVAGDGEIGFRTNVRAFIKRIRQKFRDVDPQFSQIKNYPGFGYRWLDGREQ